MRDVVSAFDEGRVHTQRFTKANGTSGDGQWLDWSYASGQPAYDARIGDALTFTPFVAQGNDAIFFPPAPGMDRRILELNIVNIASGIDQLFTEFQLYDLIGVYPLIDGDNSDVQTLDNTQAFPRYADGAGVRAVLVNHIAPAIGASDMIVEYQNTSGATKSTTWRTTTFGQNKVCYTIPGGTASGPLYCAMADADDGFTQINSVQLTSAPGGLWAIYIVKPLGYFASRTGQAGANRQATTELNFALHQGWRMPKVLDGAWLGLFYAMQGGTRAASLYGNMTFIWGCHGNSEH